MASAHPPLSAKILELTQCSICKETLKNPKCLPCIHTFCLECLQLYGKYERPGDEMPCPLCRQSFKIPANGFEDFPNNFFIEDLLKGLMIFNESPNDNTVLNCDFCGKLASGYCVQCDQHCCQSCASRHGRVRHKILSLEEKRNSQMFLKARTRFCETHKDEKLKLYCYDCELVICLMCSVLEHKLHHCQDLEESSLMFGEKLKLGYPQLNRCMQANRDELEKLEYEKADFMKQVSSSEEAINKRREELVRLIDEEHKELHHELESFKNKQLRKIQTRKNDVDN